ncbi:acyl-CoA dehydrogenase C-terminal domain-containing protein [Steroidobacter cummioxidans]|uniref:acyl-CoA dehydrogenase C-terminal domain-containing protein n=1 Tax=Steroidobacter cummioxidans TaxID=1803913 RepID=UPI000E31C4F3|nr:acyl-CoA dehydrogenase C-terminal domain-containing protein [Steroidobacter cummioxidans]
MHSYKAPIRDVRFCMQEVLGFSSHYASLPTGAGVSMDDVDSILEAVGQFAEEVLAPLNRSGDEEGAHFENGKVRSPRGFADAYKQYVDGGWPRLANPEEQGGEAAPYSLKLAMSEFMQAANHSWCMYGLLNDGAIKTLVSFADAQLIERFVPKLVSGEWMGTMCLTEPHCGSDLSQVRTRAEPRGDGSYSISGTKIFISSGEQDFSDNIVHLVLARLPDAAPGTRGISLFAVPKVDDQAARGSANSLRCLSIEHKMGLRASATCVMAFEGARGWLVGEPERGLNAMFVFINKSRLGTAQQAQAHAEGAFQSALAYARERLAGRSPHASSSGGPSALIVHPDIRRMLLTQKAIAEGGRALVLYCAKWVDLADGGDVEQRALAEQRLAVLTPIAKGALSEWASEATDLGIQILGGHGYMKEWGLEQRVRDVRITRIYEGTTGIQGMDLLGRKLLGPQRQALTEFSAEILAFCRQANGAELTAMTARLVAAVKIWLELTELAAERSASDPAFVGAAAVDYLLLAGYVSVGYMFALSAQAASSKLADGTTEEAFYRAKIQTAQFYFDKLLPRIHAHAASIGNGSESLTGMPEASFGLEV